MINLDELLAKIEAAATAAEPWWNKELEVAEWDPYRGCYHPGGDTTNFIQILTPEIALEVIAELRQLASVHADAQRLIIEQQQTIARLRTELAARTPPPAVAPYHRLDDIRQLPPTTINARLESESIDEAWKHSQGGNAAETKAALIAEFPEYGEQLSICYCCDNQSNDLYLLPDGVFAQLCTACASHHGAILAD